VREILDSVQEGGASTDVKSFAEDNLEDDDRPEIQRILEYRKIAQDGNGATAIALLEKLKSDAPYGSGYFAFRLNLNIGVIQQNIGDYPSAAASLKAAHEFFPEHHKAQTALAFAELLRGFNLPVQHAVWALGIADLAL
jgi:tetratricopeptide (TPR) repeat protein